MKQNEFRDRTVVVDPLSVRKGFMLLGLCILCAPAISHGQVSNPAGGSGQSLALEEIVVTATRRTQALEDVPISAAVMTSQKMNARGITRIDDLVKFTPGVELNRSSYGLTSNITIRGINSLSGSATTAVYINNTPIQTRSIGNSSANAWPVIFDLKRVAVLRGPQGTLFGASAEGGAVRFITRQPSLTEFSGDMRAGISFTDGGAPSYELGVGAGGPLVQGKLGYRVSGYSRRDGGFVDRLPYPDGVVTDENSNTITRQAIGLALKWAPTDNLTITPSLHYQNLESDGTSGYWLRVAGKQISHPGEGEYINGDTIASTNYDRFVLPALQIQWNLGGVTFESNTSYFSRKEGGVYDYTAFMNNIFGFGVDPTATLASPGYVDVGHLWNKQKNWMQELRLSSNNPGGLVNWQVGVFWMRAEQSSHQDIEDPFFERITGIPPEIFYGIPVLPGHVVYLDHFRTVDTRTALFGQVDIHLSDALDLTFGARNTWAKLDFLTTRAGPAQGGPGRDEGTNKETPFTPKITLTWRPTAARMYYASVADGFRMGGVNRGIPTNATCGAALAAIGLKQAPTTYESDSVRSYEIGTKGRALSGSLQLNGSVYYIKWEDIISGVGLPGCGFGFTDNLGSATIKGAEFQVAWNATDSMSFSASVGYNHGEFDETITPDPTPFAPHPNNLITAGYTTGGAPWVVALSGRYAFTGLKMDIRPYVRVDVSWRAQNDAPMAVHDPANANYDPLIPRNPERKTVKLRAGVINGGLDLSFFVNNLTNEHPVLNVGHVTPFGQIFTARAIRPRTMGVTAQYHFK